MQTNRYWALILAFAAGSFLGGCGEAKGPVTVPVAGKLVYLRGGQAKALADRQGLIEFASIAQPGVRAFGEIQEDGSFQLTSVKDGVGSAGLVPGAHRVCLRLDATARQYVAPQFLSFEHSKLVAETPPVAAPGKEIVIQVWR